MHVLMFVVMTAVLAAQDHHSPTFLADDSAIPVGIKSMSVVILDYLSRHK